MKKNYLNYIFSISLCLFVGISSSAATSLSVKTWYKTLAKPSFTPPEWVFPIAWSILYIVMAISWGMILSARNHRQIKKAHFFFLLHLIFNFSWSFIYFGAHQITYAWIDINCLCIALIATIYYFYKISKLAAYLLLPYLIWVCFANVLNGSIWYLNIFNH